MSTVLVCAWQDSQNIYCTNPSGLSVLAQLLEVSEYKREIWCEKDGGTALLKATTIIY